MANVSMQFSTLQHYMDLLRGEGDYGPEVEELTTLGVGDHIEIVEDPREPVEHVMTVQEREALMDLCFGIGTEWGRSGADRLAALRPGDTIRVA